MHHVGKYKSFDQRYCPNQSYKTAQHQYTESTTFITCEEDPISEGEAATEAADIAQVTHAATVEIHNTNAGQNTKPSKLNVIFATD